MTSPFQMIETTASCRADMLCQEMIIFLYCLTALFLSHSPVKPQSTGKLHSLGLWPKNMRGISRPNNGCLCFFHLPSLDWHSFMSFSSLLSGTFILLFLVWEHSGYLCLIFWLSMATSCSTEPSGDLGVGTCANIKGGLFPSLYFYWGAPLEYLCIIHRPQSVHPVWNKQLNSFCSWSFKSPPWKPSFFWL